MDLDRSGQTAEVLVLGAGHAGLSAARACAAKGIHVHVLEKKMEMRNEEW